MRALFLFLLASFVACRDAPPDPVASPPPAPAKPQLVAAAFGRPLNATTALTPLTDVAKDPTAFRGKTIATQGTVTRVCQERGCWLAIQDSSSSATVRMHGHSFFVPTTSAGKHARVEGTVLLMKDGRECDDMTAAHADIELDAVGVELL